MLGRDPHAGKALQGELAGLRSLRLGGHRIVYRAGSARVIDIVAVGPRKTIYEQTLRLIGGASGPEDIKAAIRAERSERRRPKR